MATKKYLHNLNLLQNQLLNAVLHPSATAPATPVDGQVYYNNSTADNKLYIYVGGTHNEWRPVGVTEAAELYFNDAVALLETATVQGAIDVLADKIRTHIAPVGTAHNGAQINVDTTDLTNLKGPSQENSGSVQALFGYLNDFMTSMITHANQDVEDKHQANQIGFDGSAIGQAADTTLQEGVVAAYNALTVLIDSTLKPPTPLSAAVSAGEYPSGAQKGDTFRITTAGTLGGRNVNIEDLLICLVDNAGVSNDADWMVAESNREQASEALLGLLKLATTAETLAGIDDTKAVTPKKLKDFATGTTMVADAAITRRVRGQIDGNGSLTDFPVNHMLNTSDIDVVIRTIPGNEIVSVVWVSTGDDDITISFNAAVPSGTSYKYTIIG